MGDTVPNAITDLTLWVAVSRAVGQRLEWVRNGEVISTTSLTERQSATLRATVQAGDWLSVILRDDAGPTLFSNAIYIAQR